MPIQIALKNTLPCFLFKYHVGSQLIVKYSVSQRQLQRVPSPRKRDMHMWISHFEDHKDKRLQAATQANRHTITPRKKFALQLRIQMTPVYLICFVQEQNIIISRLSDYQYTIFQWWLTRNISSNHSECESYM